MPQELTSLVGRYGKHLSGSDVEEDGSELESREFDDETRELIGLDDIAEIIGEIDQEADMDVEAMEQEAQAIKEGKDPANISDPDEVIEEMDQDFRARPTAAPDAPPTRRTSRRRPTERATTRARHGRCRIGSQSPFGSPRNACFAVCVANPRAVLIHTPHSTRSRAVSRLEPGR